jgi:predicted dehydrogenase
MRKAKIGVVGAGWWSTEHHIPSLLGYDRVEFVGIADPKPDKLAAAANHYGIEGRYKSHSELLEVPDLDGVVIAIPHAYHYEVARDALDAGVNVLLEKPMVLKAEQAWDLVRLADVKGLHLSIGYTFQYTRHALKAKKIVQSGAIGDIRFVSGVFASMVERYLRGVRNAYAGDFGYPVTAPEDNSYSDPAISGGGQGHLQITHAMGMAFWVMELRATQVFAMMESFDLAVDLVDAISYRLENGAIGTMGATGSIQPGQPTDQGIKYYGTKGFVRQDLAKGSLDIHYNDGTSETHTDLSTKELYPAHVPSRSFADLVLDGGDNAAPAKFGAYTVEFLEAAYTSAASGLPVCISQEGR